MNRKQHIVIALAAVLIVFLILFPPWIVQPNRGAIDSDVIRYWPHLSFAAPELPEPDVLVPAPQSAPQGKRLVRPLNLAAKAHAYAQPERDNRLMLGIQAAVLVLSMAAVMVLEDRRQ